MTFNEANMIKEIIFRGILAPSIALETKEVIPSIISDKIRKTSFVIDCCAILEMQGGEVSRAIGKKSIARILRSQKVQMAFAKSDMAIAHMAYNPEKMVIMPLKNYNELVEKKMAPERTVNYSSIKTEVDPITTKEIRVCLKSTKFYREIFDGAKSLRDLVDGTTPKLPEVPAHTIITTTQDFTAPVLSSKPETEVSNKFEFNGAKLETFNDIEYNGEVYYFPPSAPEAYDCVKNNENIYIYGPHGCGKTVLARLLFLRKGVEPLEVDFSAGVDEASFLGTPTVAIDEHGNKITKFQYGIFPRAIIEDRPLIINEIDFAKSQYLAALHGIMEAEDPKLILMDNDCEVLRPKKGGNFGIAVTANTIGNGDDLADYHGTSPLNAAFMDRFDSYFQLSYTDREINIIKSILEPDLPGLHTEHLSTQLMKFIQDIRRLKDSGKISTGISTRRVKMLCSKIKRIGLKAAITNVLITRMDDDDRESMKEVSQRFFPDYF